MCDCVLAGGYEALTELIYVGFDCLQAMSPDCCRPFDVARNGLMLGEAAAFAVLESESHARARGARILCELAGYGHGTDLHHLTQPHPSGATAVAVMRQAIAASRRAASRTSATSTRTARARRSMTPAKAQRSRRCLGMAATIPSRLRISSTKAAIGHTLGAAGSIEALFAIAALRSGQLPPNLNVQQPEPIVAANLVAVGERRTGHAGDVDGESWIWRIECRAGFQEIRVAPALDKRDRVDSQTDCCLSPFAGWARCFPRKRRPRMKGLNEATGEHVVRCVDRTREPLATLQNEARVRRASPLTLYMLAAAQQALAAVRELPRDRLGIVASFNTGAVVATRRFFEGVIKSGQRFASPNLFPETVFNSPTSHVAAVLGVAGPCYSLVGDDAAWVSAIRVAASWLANGLVDHALVIGAVELDPIVIDAFARAGWLPPHGRTGYVPSEGAGALLLRRVRTGKTTADRAIGRRVHLSQPERCAASRPGNAWRNSQPTSCAVTPRSTIGSAASKSSCPAARA